MSGTRRKFFQDAAILGAGLFGLGSEMRAQQTLSGAHRPGSKTRNALNANPSPAPSTMLTPDHMRVSL